MVIYYFTLQYRLRTSTSASTFPARTTDGVCLQKRETDRCASLSCVARVAPFAKETNIAARLDKNTTQCGARAQGKNARDADDIFRHDAVACPPRHAATSGVKVCAYRVSQRRALSQLMRGDVTKTKPCALARRRSARVKSGPRARRAQQHTFGVHGGGKVRLASPRHLDSRRKIRRYSREFPVVVVARASSPAREPGCRSYPRTGAARARNG